MVWIWVLLVLGWSNVSKPPFSSNTEVGLGRVFGLEGIQVQLNVFLVVEYNQ